MRLSASAELVRGSRAGVEERRLVPPTDCQISGRGDRIRTCDPHTPSVMRYQAALRPDRGWGTYAGEARDASAEGGCLVPDLAERQESLRQRLDHSPVAALERIDQFGRATLHQAVECRGRRAPDRSVAKRSTARIVRIER